MRCTTCDYQLPDDSTVTFCPNCGARVIQSQESVGSSFPLPPTVAPPPSYGTPQQSMYSPAVSDIPRGTIPSGAYIAPVANSTAAIVSLVFGILSWVMLPFVGAIVAVVAGHMARREISASGEQIGGRGLATAGLILGYVHLALIVIGGCLFILFIGIAATVAS